MLVSLDNTSMHLLYTGPVTPSIYWSCKIFTDPTKFYWSYKIFFNITRKNIA